MEQQNTILADKIANIIRFELKNERARSIPVGVSNRHIHLSQKDLETLFGTGYQLSELKPLSQPGQYAAKESVTIAGPKGSITKVRVLGPVRKETQIEISKADGFVLGVVAPLRESGNLTDSGSISVIGPMGSIYLHHNVIVAKRHIHMTPKDAREFYVNNGQIVSVTTVGERSVTFGDVVVRVSPDFRLELHIDMDEANAAGLRTQDHVKLGYSYG